jgi:hypothetical protein
VTTSAASAAETHSAAIASAHSQAERFSPAMRRASSSAAAHFVATPTRGEQATRTATRSSCGSSAGLPSAAATARSSASTARTVRPRTVSRQAASFSGVTTPTIKRATHDQARHGPGDLTREHGLAQQRQLRERPPDPRPLAHGTRAHAEALAAPVAQAAKAQRLVAAPAQQRCSQGPEQRPHPRALGHELAQAAIGIAPAQEDERGDRGPARRGGGGSVGARLCPAPHGPCTHGAGRAPGDLGVTLRRANALPAGAVALSSRQM